MATSSPAEAIEIGARIRSLRESARLKQLDLAKACGFTPQYIATMEAGRQMPSIAALLLLARALDTTVCVLIGDDPRHPLPVVTVATQYIVDCAICGTVYTGPDRGDAGRARVTHLAHAASDAHGGSR